MCWLENAVEFDVFFSVVPADLSPGPMRPEQADQGLGKPLRSMKAYAFSYEHTEQKVIQKVHLLWQLDSDRTQFRENSVNTLRWNCTSVLDLSPRGYYTLGLKYCVGWFWCVIYQDKISTSVRIRLLLGQEVSVPATPSLWNWRTAHASYTPASDQYCCFLRKKTNKRKTERHYSSIHVLLSHSARVTIYCSQAPIRLRW